MANNYGKGIHLSTGFDLGAKLPLDSRTVVQTRADMLALDENIKPTGLFVYVIDDNIQYKWTGSKWEVNNVGFKDGTGAPSNNSGNTGDMYINRSNGDVYFKLFDNASYTVSWKYIMNITGPKGDRGSTGATGAKGSIWNFDNAIKGTAGGSFSNSTITNARLDDWNINSSGEVYKCTKAGAPGTAEWTYEMNITGPKGSKGDKGDVGPQGIQGLKGDKGDKGDTGPIGSNIFTGIAMYGVYTSSATFPDAKEIDGDVAVNDIYINTEYGDIYKATEAGQQNAIKWAYWNTISVQHIFFGDLINDDSIAAGNGIVSNTGIKYATMHDYYINSVLGKVYRCTKSGDPNTAVWKKTAIFAQTTDFNGIAYNQYVKSVVQDKDDPTAILVTHGDNATNGISLVFPTIAKTSDIDEILAITE